MEHLKAAQKEVRKEVRNFSERVAGCLEEDHKGESFGNGVVADGLEG